MCLIITIYFLKNLKKIIMKMIIFICYVINIKNIMSEYLFHILDFKKI